MPNKIKDILILAFVLAGAIAIFMHSLDRDSSKVRVVNQEPGESYLLQTKPENLFKDKVRLKASIIDTVK